MLRVAGREMEPEEWYNYHMFGCTEDARQWRRDRFCAAVRCFEEEFPDTPPSSVANFKLMATQTFRAYHQVMLHTMEMASVRYRKHIMELCQKAAPGDPGTQRRIAKGVLRVWNQLAFNPGAKEPSPLMMYLCGFDEKGRPTGSNNAIENAYECVAAISGLQYHAHEPATTSSASPVHHTGVKAATRASHR